MADTKILSEKLKYLIGMESNQEFEIFDLDLDFYTGLSGYQLIIKFDYFGAIDSEIPNFYGDMAEMMEKIQEIVSKVTVTPEKKISLSQKVSLETLIDQIDFRAGDRHIFIVNFLVHYLDKD